MVPSGGARDDNLRWKQPRPSPSHQPHTTLRLLASTTALLIDPTVESAFAAAGSDGGALGAAASFLATALATPLANQLLSVGLAAVLWTVQLVIYPAFRWIEPARFVAWHRSYTPAITVIVAPLILGQLAVLLLALFAAAGPVSRWLLVELGCCAVAWAVTFTVSVPIHQQLQRHRSSTAIDRLISTNWIRTLAWSGAALASLLAS